MAIRLRSRCLVEVAWVNQSMGRQIEWRAAIARRRSRMKMPSWRVAALHEVSTPVRQSSHGAARVQFARILLRSPLTPFILPALLGIVWEVTARAHLLSSSLFPSL